MIPITPKCVIINLRVMLCFKGLATSDLSQSLRDQLSDTTNTEVLRLELENQRLQKLLADQREQSIVENSAHILELEKENKRLASKVLSDILN